MVLFIYRKGPGPKEQHLWSKIWPWEDSKCGHKKFALRGHHRPIISPWSPFLFLFLATLGTFTPGTTGFTLFHWLPEVILQTHLTRSSQPSWTLGECFVGLVHVCDHKSDLILKPASFKSWLATFGEQTKIGNRYRYTSCSARIYNNDFGRKRNATVPASGPIQRWIWKSPGITQESCHWKTQRFGVVFFSGSTVGLKCWNGKPLIYRKLW